MPERHLELDVLDALGDFAREMSVAGELGSGDFAAGQRAFFDRLAERIAEEPDGPAGPILVATAGDLGVEFGEDGTVPDDAEQAGALAAWGLSLGYIEGITQGAQMVIDAMQDLRDEAGD